MPRLGQPTDPDLQVGQTNRRGAMLHQFHYQYDFSSYCESAFVHQLAHISTSAATNLLYVWIFFVTCFS